MYMSKLYVGGFICTFVGLKLILKEEIIANCSNLRLRNFA